RKRRAFAFILNKWDRCQHPGASGMRPDDDLLKDLDSQGFRNPLIFRTCAQHWVDHPWQMNGSLALTAQESHPTSAPNGKPPVEGEQFLDLLRWLEQGLNRLEIEAIKARGVSQLLRHLQEALEAGIPPDLIQTAGRVQEVWRKSLAEEAHTSA